MKIWINRAGLSKTAVIAMLRDNPDRTPLEIHATRPGGDGPALAFADVRGSEPDWDATDKQYAAFALDYVRRHEIDVLIPTCRIVALASRAQDFAEAGCVLMASVDRRVASITDSKSGTYAAALALGVAVPEWHKVSSADAFAAAVAHVRRGGRRACVKPDTSWSGWSADGFRELYDAEHGLVELLAAPKPLISAAAYERALRQAEEQGRLLPELIVMPFLEEPEVSIDCLSTTDGRLLMSVARVKGDPYRTFADDPRLIGIARALVEGLPLAYLSNVQVRWEGDEPKLLEVNARVSAGVAHTGHTGLNLPWSALKLATTGDAGSLRQPDLSGRIAVVGTSILVP
ncbi:hypothetical protein DSM104299_00219 [Baekduia alba]|uniref:ATP-grasp domain-containing protein n=1 Tax=Baekduia alba TaxID=2997333 RepID=UPI00233F91C0|nr:ATP-grasp domain-containing protein [Baekduia alba]WCB91548.1 hypothetical protein DSM104299_00219 [Baekduia alba]